MANNNTRLILAVQECIGSLLHEFDVSQRDCEPDREAWNGVSIQLEGLVARAYKRNHNGEPG